MEIEKDSEEGEAVVLRRRDDQPPESVNHGGTI
jgi:hypothetical protein